MATRIQPISEDLAVGHESLKAPEGQASNLARTAAHSPAVLESLVQQMQAKGRMTVSARTRASIALRVCQLHSCEYGLAAATHHAEKLGLRTAQILASRRGCAADPHEQALLALASKLVRDRGQHAGFVVDSAAAVGVTPREVIEVVALVASHTFKCLLASVASAELDFPPAVELELATMPPSSVHTAPATSRPLPRRNAASATKGGVL